MVQRTGVVVFIKGLGIGGAEKLISEAARLWDREHLEYHIAYQLPWKNQLVAELEALDLPVTCVGGKNGSSAHAAWSLPDLTRTTRASMVHAHLPSAGVIARLTSRVPIVYTEHNLASSYRQPTRALNQATYGRNRAITAVSDAVAESVSNYPGPPVRVIPNGVAVNVAPEQADTARHELGLTRNDPLIVHVGNIRPHKGHETLIDTVTELIRSCPEVVVASIGGEKHDGDLDRVRAAAVAAGVESNLRFLGRRTDSLSFVAAADAFVNPSDLEGLPVAVLEAMSLGTPVVATAVGGVPAVIRNEETGLLADAGDSSALSMALLRLLSDRDLGRRLATRARALVEREYGLESMVRSFEDIYREILDD